MSQERRSSHAGAEEQRGALERKHVVDAGVPKAVVEAYQAKRNATSRSEQRQARRQKYEQLDPQKQDVGQKSVSGPERSDGQKRSASGGLNEADSARHTARDGSDGSPERRQQTTADTPPVPMLGTEKRRARKAKYKELGAEEQAKSARTGNDRTDSDKTARADGSTERGRSSVAEMSSSTSRPEKQGAAKQERDESRKDAGDSGSGQPPKHVRGEKRGRIAEVEAGNQGRIEAQKNTGDTRSTGERRQSERSGSADNKGRSQDATLSKDHGSAERSRKEDRGPGDGDRGQATSERSPSPDRADKVQADEDASGGTLRGDRPLGTDRTAKKLAEPKADGLRGELKDGRVSADDGSSEWGRHGPSDTTPTLYEPKMAAERPQFGDRFIDKTPVEMALAQNEDGSVGWKLTTWTDGPDTPDSDTTERLVEKTLGGASGSVRVTVMNRISDITDGAKKYTNFLSRPLSDPVKPTHTGTQERSDVSFVRQGPEFGVNPGDAAAAAILAIGLVAGGVHHLRNRTDNGSERVRNAVD